MDSNASADELREHLARRPVGANVPDGVEAWVRGFAEFGKDVCVRVSVAAARAALEAWETYEPTIRAGGPYERIAAAEAWLACPCETHRLAAEHLAWANGDDNPLRWTRLVVDGNDIASMEAIYAHWSSDNAVSVTHNDASLAEQIIQTGFAAAAQSLSLLHRAPLNTERVIASIVRELRLACLSMSPVEITFLEALERDPQDSATKQVYADWLEERGRTTEANDLRSRR